LKEIIIEKELEQTKDELLKKKFALEKKRNHKSLCFSGLETCFISNSKISKHQYYQLKKHKTRIKPKFIECLYWVRWCRDDYFEYRNNPLMRLINQDLDTDYGHRK
jgi:hypothetical protein